MMSDTRMCFWTKTREMGGRSLEPVETSSLWWKCHPGNKETAYLSAHLCGSCVGQNRSRVNREPGPMSRRGHPLDSSPAALQLSRAGGRAPSWQELHRGLPGA